MKYFIRLLGEIHFLLYKIRFFHRLKITGYQYFCGKNAIINVDKDAFMELQSKFFLSRNSRISASHNGILKIGYNNYFNANVSITAMKEVMIGDNNLFGPNVVIVDHKHRYDKKDMLFCKQGYECEKIKIGSNNWICANVVITQGVTIENNIVIGANSVVTHDLLESGVYSGCPAKLIKNI